MQTLVVVKHSKLEWDCKNSGAPRHEMVAHYRKAGANVDTILASHDYQLRVRDQVYSQISQQLMFLDEYERLCKSGLTPKTDLVISVGGDNSFTRVSHFLDDTPILGVCSDPLRSVGHLCTWKAGHEKSIGELQQRLGTKNFEVEDWTRIGVVLDGKSLGEWGINEVFLGEKERTSMSRYLLDDVEVKSSGLVVYTGAGSTGWACSAGAQPFDRKEATLGFIHTEAYTDGMEWTKEAWHTIDSSENLVVKSLNDNGILSFDGWGRDTEYKFQRGSVAELRTGLPLKVLVFPEGK